MLVAGEPAAYTVEVRNPLSVPARARVKPVLPLGWRSSETQVEVELGPGEESSVQLTVIPASPGRRQRIAIDVAIGDLRLGQHAEALLDVAEARS